MFTSSGEDSDDEDDEDTPKHEGTGSEKEVPEGVGADKQNSDVEKEDTESESDTSAGEEKTEMETENFELKKQLRTAQEERDKNYDEMIFRNDALQYVEAAKVEAEKAKREAEQHAASQAERILGLEAELLSINVQNDKRVAEAVLEATATQAEKILGMEKKLLAIKERELLGDVDKRVAEEAAALLEEANKKAEKAEREKTEAEQHIASQADRILALEAKLQSISDTESREVASTPDESGNVENEKRRKKFWD